MAEKISYLIGRFITNVGGNGVADSNRNKFTVNTAVNEVNIDTSTVPDWFYIMAFSNTYTFSARDSIRLLSAGVMIPHGFTVGKTNFRLSFARFATFQSGATGTQTIEELSCNGIDPSFSIPFHNYEHALDIYLPFPTQTSVPATNVTKFLIRAQITAGDISMLNAPSASNGQTYTPIPFLKVLHTLDMGI